ncbi:MAG: hypothetical protein M3O35_11965 [Acidobacteriota bacterium]|nr:hypothetical protein [Acidobacteriota bacterium]
MSQTYQVTVPFVGVHPDADHAFEVVTIERGAIITVDTKHTSQRSGLVEVLFQGTVLAAYLRDIEDRAEPLSDTSEE